MCWNKIDNTFASETNRLNELDMARMFTLLIVLVLCGCNKITAIDTMKDVRLSSATGFRICPPSQQLYGKSSTQIRFNRIQDRNDDSNASDKQQKDLIRLSTTPSL